MVAIHKQLDCRSQQDAASQQTVEWHVIRPGIQGFLESVAVDKDLLSVVVDFVSRTDI
jgi:hypothetical protein